MEVQRITWIFKLGGGDNIGLVYACEHARRGRVYSVWGSALPLRTVVVVVGVVDIKKAS